ncbi:protein kinase [Rugamonas aquatica]|uniref:Protein kinase n=1 Tax=Rugamonas aquatica TaxID=2743357 RepID=A0A6A7MX28_9BURK|nr:protein kinase [Rugamonas aquatica]
MHRHVGITALGEGGYGEVYEAWDTQLCRSVAIKCIKHVGGRSPGADLMREARLAASLRHAAFVKVYSLQVRSTPRSCPRIRARSLARWT